MFQLTVLAGKAAGHSRVVRRFPFDIGRVEANQLILADQGVWAEHARLELSDSEGVRVSARSAASVAVNAEVLTEPRHLRNGDVISLGAVKLQFSLAAPVQRGLRLREGLVWGLLAALLGAELWLLVSLPH
jgi:pSer/pThr/pTyr-binding forkhead associated (FHA) protein